MSNKLVNNVERHVYVEFKDGKYEEFQKPNEFHVYKDSDGINWLKIIMPIAGNSKDAFMIHNIPLDAIKQYNISVDYIDPPKGN